MLFCHGEAPFGLSTKDLLLHVLLDIFLRNFCIAVSYFGTLRGHRYRYNRCVWIS